MTTKIENPNRPYSLAYISAGWVAYNKPLPGDMWQEMLHYQFIVDDTMYNKQGKLMGVVVRELTRDSKGQYLPKKEEKNQTFWSMRQFAEKIMYITKDDFDPYDVPQDGDAGLCLNAFREHDRKHREFVCYKCKLEILVPDQNLRVEDKKDYHERCFS